MDIITAPRVGVDEYLEWELEQARRHEYIDGEVFEMPGASGNHSIIITNLTIAFASILERPRYIIHHSDLKIQASPTAFLYADLSIVRGASRYASASELSLLNPALVAEVTSPSTRHRDRGVKLEQYYGLASIDAVLILEQDFVRAELYTRGDADWQMRVYTDLAHIISLPMLDCELPLREVYHGVAL